MHERENALIAAPTGSGKCVKPSTPLIVRIDGEARVLEAEELLDETGDQLAEVDGKGELYDSSVEAYSLSDGGLDLRESMVYREPFEGDLYSIQTTYGRAVEVSGEHPLLVETETGVEWRAASEIATGDKIGVPGDIELPEEPIELDVDAAVEAVRDRFERVLTAGDATSVISELRAAEDIDSVLEETLRDALSLADLSMSAAAERLEIGIASVHKLVTGRSTYRGTAFLELLADEVEPLGRQELLVRTSNGRTSRFRYQRYVDERIARITAFVLAEGFVGDYEDGRTINISQKNRSELLEDVQRWFTSIFGVKLRQRSEIDYALSDSAFVTFFSELLGIEYGPGRGVRFPDWVLNAPADSKRAFVESFISLEGEVREDVVRITQANPIKIEQLNYILLSFGVFPARRTDEKYATNTDSETKREYTSLVVRRKDDLRRLTEEFDITHPNADSLERYAAGSVSGSRVKKYAFDYEKIRALSSHFGSDREFNERLGDIYEVVRRSGHITERALEKLQEAIDELPDSEAVRAVEERIESISSRNVVWLEASSVETVGYEGDIIDLSVPDTHNFVGGAGGLYLHNTLASFTSIINELFARDRAEGLENSVYCLYVSPLKSLANDIHRNLEVPLGGITEKLNDRGEDVEIRHAIRHGDTSDADRQAMLSETPHILNTTPETLAPHILNTTPETLAILLNSPKFREKLRTVEYVVVDEIHSLAENKRGTHLSVSLERLEALAHGSPTRIGCSATVEPLDSMAEFLVGQVSPGGDPRAYELVDARFAREFDMELTCPTDDLVNTPPDVVNDRFYRDLHALVEDHTNTLVFTNTRSGAERVLQNLRERYDDYDEDNSGCHHGSLSKGRRQAIEEQLKAGELDVVTTSTSLELGIDMPHIDLVVQVGSPKSVAALLQRVGRAGHQLGETVTGRVVALDRDELVECAVMLKKAEEGFVDRVFVPENAQDVAAQHVYGMAIADIRPEADIRGILERAYPYHDYADEDWESLMRYLTADYEGMEDKNVYAKVWRDANDAPDGEHHYEEYDVGRPLMGKRGRLARVIYMTNIGTIPDSFTCDVFTQSGDVFVLGGSNYEYRYRRGSKVYVDPTSARPTVPSWFSERLPLSYDLGREVLAFQRELLDKFDRGGVGAVRHWLREYPLDENSVRAVARMFEEQVKYTGFESVSTDERLVVEEERDREEYERRYHVHSNYGRRFNDGFSRLLAHRIAQEANANVQVAVADNGFSLSMPLNRKVDVTGVIDDLGPADVRPDLRASLDGTDLLQRYFRINATRALMILKRYKGYEKSASEQQMNSEMLLGFAEDLPEFAVIEETYREILEDKLNVDAIEDVLGAIRDGSVTVERYRVDSPSPRAFGLATLMASDVVLAEDESEVLQRFHERVMAEIDDDGASGVGSESD
ncbi:ATP-dependent helicase [Halobacteriales archaeon QS_9_67_15]|nr:MAG: ATP-dependent helicase [Halobacteriales archaeon QS_9_67_15]